MISEKLIQVNCKTILIIIKTLSKLEIKSLLMGFKMMTNNEFVGVLVCYHLYKRLDLRG